MNQEIEIETNKNVTKPIVAHLRYYKDEPLYERTDVFDRVVSVAWSYDYSADILRYGATVFKRTETDKCWFKDIHRQKAVDRYYKCPVRVQMSYEDNVRSFSMNSYVSNSGTIEVSENTFEWLIASKLIFCCGCSNEDQNDIKGKYNMTREKALKYSPPEQEERKEIKVPYIESYDINYIIALVCISSFVGTLLSNMFYN